MSFLERAGQFIEEHWGADIYNRQVEQRAGNLASSFAHGDNSLKAAYEMLTRTSKAYNLDETDLRERLELILTEKADDLTPHHWDYYRSEQASRDRLARERDHKYHDRQVKERYLTRKSQNSPGVVAA